MSWDERWHEVRGFIIIWYNMQIWYQIYIWRWCSKRNWLTFLEFCKAQTPESAVHSPHLAIQALLRVSPLRDLQSKPLERYWERDQDGPTSDNVQATPRHNHFFLITWRCKLLCQFPLLCDLFPRRICIADSNFVRCSGSSLKAFWKMHSPTVAMMQPKVSVGACMIAAVSFRMLKTVMASCKACAQSPLGTRHSDRKVESAGSFPKPAGSVGNPLGEVS